MKGKTIVLFDDQLRDQLLPLTFTRPAACLRSGIMTNAERWHRITNQEPVFLTEDYLHQKYPAMNGGPKLCFNGRYLPWKGLADMALALQEGEAIFDGDVLVALATQDTFHDLTNLHQSALHAQKIKYEGQLIQYNRPWHLFQMLDQLIRLDFEYLCGGRVSEPLSDSNTLLGNNIFIEKGAKVEAATINTTTGPVYIGANAEIMEGSLIRGPFALGDYAALKMGAKVYGATSIGPHCKVGGEVNNVSIAGYSNKAHDGFLGNAVIGEWCNLGADTNNSNLKNNYAEVRLYDYVTGRFIATGLTFCGLIMGDHSKCGINTMFNTGTVVGVNANIFGDGFPRNFIPSFSWGGAAGFSTYKLSDALQVAQLVMARRNMQMDDGDRHILSKVFELSEKN
jgi:UDP-N-acetylglucosamine diphosphorylase/glucosamine-1-phosphate N-acetyltransferase